MIHFPLHVHSGRFFILLTLIACAVLSILVTGRATPANAQEPGTSKPEVRVEPPPLRGGLRYGRWGPLEITITRENASSAFSGTLEVAGANGFRFSSPLTLPGERGRIKRTVPVFCNSSLPVFRVSLLDETGTVRARAQRRFPGVFGAEGIVVGISTVFSEEKRQSLQARLVDQGHGEAVLVPAREAALIEMGRWPGILDLIYLNRPADLEVPVRTDPSAPIPSVAGPSRIPQVKLVDSQAYEVFNRPGTSERRKNWLWNSVRLVLVVLLAGLLFCFRRPSSPYNWAIVLLLPVLLLLVLFLNTPREPSVIRQAVSVRVSDSRTGEVVRDGRICLFPHGKSDTSSGDAPEERNREEKNGVPRRRLVYPVDSIRTTIPVFYDEASMSSRFPELRTGEGQAEFHWNAFPEEGYFVLQEFDRVSGENGTSSVKVIEREKGRLTVRNEMGIPVRNVWLRVNGKYRSLGRIPAEGSIKVSLNERENTFDSRERLLARAFTSGSRRQRTLRRWMKYVLTTYGRDRPFVAGVIRPSGTEGRAFPDGYDQVRLPGLVFHRFETGNDRSK